MRQKPGPKFQELWEGSVHKLRPSLQAHVHLDRRHDGFATLFRKVAQFDTESVETVMTIAATDPEAAEAFLDAQCGRPLSESCHLAQGPLMSLSAKDQEQS